jgi:hypothetical protein
MESRVTYFQHEGKENTVEVLHLVMARAKELGVRKVLVPSTNGSAALAAVEALKGLQVIVVTHEAGMVEAGQQEFPEATRKDLESRGVTVVTCTHAFGGLSRAMRKKFNTHVIGDIIANTLRVFGQGMKVAVEITLMCADSGVVRTDETVIALGGSQEGVDTAIVCRPVNAQRFFDLKVQQLICKPGFVAQE